jgi:hypothetical protein
VLLSGENAVHSFKLYDANPASRSAKKSNMEATLKGGARAARTRKHLLQVREHLHERKRGWRIMRRADATHPRTDMGLRVMQPLPDAIRAADGHVAERAGLPCRVPGEASQHGVCE